MTTISTDLKSIHITNYFEKVLNKSNNKKV